MIPTKFDQFDLISIFRRNEFLNFSTYRPKCIKSSPFRAVRSTEQHWSPFR